MTTVPPSSGDKKEAAAAAGGNTALLVGGVAVLAAIGYYMTRREKPPSMGDVKKEAQDLRDVTKAKSEAAARDAKVNDKFHFVLRSMMLTIFLSDQARAEHDADKVKASGESILDKTKSAARDVKVGTEERLTSAKNAIGGYTEEAKREAEREAHKAKETTSGWFSWGKDKTEEGKEHAAGQVAKGAEDVRDAAQKGA